MMNVSEKDNSTLSMAGVGGYAALGPDEASKIRYLAIASGALARQEIETRVIAAKTGLGFHVRAGNIMRLCCGHGPQVADMIVFNANNFQEMFWSARTRVIHGGHLTTGHQLWSTPPHVAPMMTLIADTVKHGQLPHGAASHDLLFCRCDARHYEIMHDAVDVPNCQDNLAGAIAPFGLAPDMVHDPFNVFMTTGLNDDGRPFYLPCDARIGDYVEFVAEMDCLVAISACPGGSSGEMSAPLDITIFSAEG